MTKSVVTVSPDAGESVFVADAAVAAWLESVAVAETADEVDWLLAAELLAEVSEEVAPDID